jgi:hypothetical protein
MSPLLSLTVCEFLQKIKPIFWQHFRTEFHFPPSCTIEIRLYGKGTYILADIHGMDHFCTKLAPPPYNKPRRISYCTYICYFRKNPQKSLGAAPTCKMAMARTSANYIGPFSTNSLISMVGTSVLCKIFKEINKLCMLKGTCIWNIKICSGKYFCKFIFACTSRKFALCEHFFDSRQISFHWLRN